jgi:hypothetical protein
MCLLDVKGHITLSKTELERFSYNLICMKYIFIFLIWIGAGEGIQSVEFSIDLPSFILNRILF